MIRSFVGLPIPDETIRSFTRLQHGLSTARPVPEENLHLTLAYLDDQPESLLRELAEILDTIPPAPFEIRLKGVKLMGGKAPGALAVEADGGDPLVRLQSSVVRAARDVGIELERRKFRPHVTIFRFSRTAEATDSERIQAWITEYGQFPPFSFVAESLTLYRSTLGPGGAVYDVLEDFPFTGLGY